MSVGFHRGGWEVRWRDAIGPSACPSVRVRGRGARLRRGARRGLPRRSPRGHGSSRPQRRRLLLPHGRRRPLAVRLPPQRRHPDDEARLRERARGPRRPAPADRAGRARRGAPHEGDVRRAIGSGGSLAAARTSSPARGPATRSPAASGSLPAFGARSLGELSVDDVREFVAELAEEVEAGELAAKTVNNALGTLVVCLNSAVDDGLLVGQPGAARAAAPAGAHRARLPATRRDPALPRRVLGRLPPARRAADRQRAPDLRGAGAARRRPRARRDRRDDRRLPLAQERRASARRSRTASARSRSAPASAPSFAIRSRAAPSSRPAIAPPLSCS